MFAFGVYQTNIYSNAESPILDRCLAHALAMMVDDVGGTNFRRGGPISVEYATSNDPLLVEVT